MTDTPPDTGDVVDLVVSETEAGERLDRFLAARLTEVSRTRLKALIEAGHVTAGETILDKANHKVAAGAEITVDLPPPEVAEPKPEAIPLVVAYEDEHLIVVDKPAGLVVHPAPGHWTGTLVNALLHHCGASLSGVGGVARPGIVHRLDKDTSGLLVVAKTDRAHRGLAKQFADHGRSGALEREYSAFVWGAPQRRDFTIDAPIGRDGRNRLKMAVSKASDAREAITHVERLESYGAPDKPIASLLACRLETGRTHQIRVHLAHVNHPLLGDDVYGAGYRTKASHLPGAAQQALSALGRQALHAGLLGFEHPVSGDMLRFESDLPPDLTLLRQVLTVM